MAKKIYFGATTQVTTPGSITTYSITSSNISTYFTVTNSSYYFAGSGSTFTSNNAGVASSTAKTTLVAKKSGTISFDYSYSSESTYDKFTLIVGTTTVENAVSGATTSKSYSGTISVGDIIEFQYSKDSSVNKNDDQCTFSNMKIQVQGSSTTTTKQNIARKVSKCYFGVGGVARKVKKGYIGVGGVARLFYVNAIQLSATYNTYANISSLTGTEEDYAFGTVGNYAIVAGGYGSNDVLYDTVCCIQKDTLTTETATSLYYEVTDAATGQLPSYFLVIGGVDYLSGSSSTTTNKVNAYGTNLSRHILNASGDTYGVRGQQIGDYCVYSIGELADLSPASTPVDAISNSLTKTSCAPLTYGALEPASGRTTNHVVICGGQGDVADSRTQLNFYSSNLAKTTGISPVQFSSSACGNTANKALFEVDGTTAYAISDNGAVTTFSGDTTIYKSQFDYKYVPCSITYKGLAVFSSSNGLVAIDDNLVKQTVSCGNTYSSLGGMGLIDDTLFIARCSTRSIRVRTFDLSV